MRLQWRTKVVAKNEKCFWIILLHLKVSIGNHITTISIKKDPSKMNSLNIMAPTPFFLDIHISLGNQLKSLFCIERCWRYLLQKRTHSSGLSIWSISSLGEGESSFKRTVYQMSSNFFYKRNVRFRTAPFKAPYDQEWIR